MTTDFEYLIIVVAEKFSIDDRPLTLTLALVIYCFLLYLILKLVAMLFKLWIVDTAFWKENNWLTLFYFFDCFQLLMLFHNCYSKTLLIQTWLTPTIIYEPTETAVDWFLWTWTFVNTIFWLTCTLFPKSELTGFYCIIYLL